METKLDFKVRQTALSLARTADLMLFELSKIDGIGSDKLNEARKQTAAIVKDILATGLKGYGED